MHLLPSDTLLNPYSGIYELSGLGTASPQLRLVNVDSEGHELVESLAKRVHSGARTTPVSSRHRLPRASHKMAKRSSSLQRQLPGGQRTVYARVQGTETIAVSAPDCEAKCVHPAPQPATFQGASADGTKVFFTTAQELLPGDKTKHRTSTSTTSPNRSSRCFRRPEEANVQVWCGAPRMDHTCTSLPPGS